jgi:hypothetical protein
MSDYIYGSADDEYIHGNLEIMGESQRGLQDAEYVGAARALTSLRGNLAQLASQRGARYRPMQQVLRSPFKDSTQIGLTKTTPIVSPRTTFANTTGVPVTAVTRVYKSFKPNKAVVNETVAFTWQPSSGDNFVTYVAVPIPSDILLVSAFSGADNCFPNAPSAETGINCSTFSANALGVGISWPTLNGGIDMTVGFLIRGSVLGYADSSLSAAQAATSPTLLTATVTIDMTLLGPSLR